MSLADQLAPNPTKGGSNQGFNCSVAILLDTMPPDDLASFTEALAAPWRIVSHSHLERSLRAEKYAIGKGAIGKHRRGDCRCSL